MSNHMEAKRMLKSIPTVNEFSKVIESVMLSDDQKHILIQHYLHGKSLGFIADEMGFSESSIKRKHHESLCKINNMMDD